jgi:hypothetical protein
MSASYTPTHIGGICQFCHLGEMYQYVEDTLGKLRCGRCGEKEAEAQEAEGLMLSSDESPVKRTATRKKTEE